MAKMSVEQVLERQKIAQNKKDDFKSLYEDAMEFALPQRNLYGGEYEGRVGGKKKMSRVFDSTAINSTQRFANRLQSGIFPPQRKWCRLEPGTDIPVNRRSEAQRVLDLYNEKLFAVLKQSNFDIAMGEFLLDLSVGTAVMLVQPGDATSPINFIPVPQYLVSFEEGANGQVDNVYRNMRIKGESIQLQWKDAKIPVDLQQRISDKPTEEVDLVEATILNIDRGDYSYYVIDKKSKQELVYRKLKSSPWVVSRYMKVAGEIYGRGPVLTALPDIKTLNKTKELLLKNASLAITGVYTAADDGVLNPANAEVVERMKELAQNLGSAFGRLVNETMIPLVTKILEVMDRDGIIDLPLKVNGLEVKVSPVSPLAMAQNLDEINNIIQFMQITQGLGPEGQMAINAGAAIDYIADKLGVPAAVRTSAEERKAMMQQMAQMAQQALPAEGGAAPALQGAMA